MPLKRAEISEAYYANKYGSLAHEFWTLTSRVDEYQRSKQWGLLQTFDDHWVSFGRDNRVAFGVGFHTSTVMGLYFKVAESDGLRLKPPGETLIRYRKTYKQAEYGPHVGLLDLAPFARLFEAGYQTLRDV